MEHRSRVLICATAMQIAIAVLNSGCSSTYDPRLPLNIGNIPTDAASIARLQARMPTGGERLRNSLELTVRARDNYMSDLSDARLAIATLGKALDAAPKNPYAWVQLGAYLARDHQPLAAALATERGLNNLHQLCYGGSQEQSTSLIDCLPEVEDLRQTANINLAMYRTSAGKPLLATLALSSLDPNTLPPFHRLAYHWTAADVMTRLGDTVRADEELTGAESVPPIAAADIRYYPHYGGNRRVAAQSYLTGLVYMERARTARSVADGRTELARASENLERSLKNYGGNWDAQLALANVRVQQNRLDDALHILRPLAEVVPAEAPMVQPERIHFNLGNVYLARFNIGGSIQDLDAAHSAYDRAARAVHERSERIKAVVEKANVLELRAEVADFFVEALVSRRAVFGEALNNLGLTYYSEFEHASERATRAALFTAAEVSWRRAVGDSSWNDRHLAWANLARLYIHDERIAAAVDAADQALAGDPYHVAALSALVEFALNETDPAKAAHVAFAVASLVNKYHGGNVPALIRHWLEQLRYRVTLDIPSRDTDRATIAILLATGQHRLARREIQKSISVHHDWGWPVVKLTAMDLPVRLLALEPNLDTIANSSVHTYDWVGRRERGEALAVRAALRAAQGDPAGARRDIERAIADGADSRELQQLTGIVNANLSRKDLPLSQIIAVLPFILVHDVSDTWPRAISTSLAELLQTVPELRAVQLESDTVAVLQERTLSPAQVARRSGAGVVLGGYLSVAAGLVVVDVALWDAATQTPIALGTMPSGKTLQTRRYSTSREHMHTLLESIVQDVISALRLRSVSADALRAAHPTLDGEAYAAFLSAMEALYSAQPQGARLAERHFVNALEEDPLFAAALAGRVYAMYALANLYEQPANTMRAAHAMAESAAMIAPHSGFIHTALALVRTWFDWDLEGGDAAFRRAIELEPHRASHHRYYGDLLLAQGCFHEALAEKDRASELAPLSPVTQLELALPLFYLGQHDDAVRQLKESLTLDPTSWRAYLYLAWVYTALGDYEQAHYALDAAERYKTGRSAYLLSHRAVTFARAHRFEEAEMILRDLLAHNTDDVYILPLLIARIYDALGRSTEACEQLSRASEDRSESIVWLKVDPWLQIETKRSSGLYERVAPLGHCTGQPPEMR